MPATVLIIPSGVTLRILLLPSSAINKLPAASSTTSDGWLSWAAVAGPPSPLNPLATRAFCPRRRADDYDTVGVDLPDAVIRGVGDEQIASPIHHNTPRIGEPGRGGGAKVSFEASPFRCLPPC